MKKRKLLAGLALLGASFFVLASCGNNKKPDNPADPGTGEVGGETGGETGGGVIDEIDETLTAIKMGDKTYETLAAAFADIPTDSTATYVIQIPKGTHNVPNGINYNGSATIYLKGMTNEKYGTDVIIKGRGSNMASMRAREMIEIQGTGNIYLKNLTLESDYFRSETTKDVQAEVLGTDTKGNTVAINCSFLSHQDTLRTAGKAWFYGCYIEGDTDFLWMEQAGTVALYEKCEIVSVYDPMAKTHASYVTAPRMGITSKVGKGLVIYNSTVREAELGQVKAIALSAKSNIKLNLAQGDVLTVEVARSSGKLTINGTDKPITNSESEQITYTAEADGEITITGTENRAFITKIKVKNGNTTKVDYDFNKLVEEKKGSAEAIKDDATIANTEDITFTECKASFGQKTYLARSPWTSGYYNQVAYVNVDVEGAEVTPWYGSMCPVNLPQTIIGWKMDQATATKVGYAGNNDILSADDVAKEFAGRNNIINRIYNTGKQKYERDNNYWDLNALIAEFGWAVDADTSKDVNDGEVAGATTTYLFDGSADQSALCVGFAKEADKENADGTVQKKPHYKGAAGNTITVPVEGKCYVEVYGYYSGVAEVKADTQGAAVAFFNNGSTSVELEQDYIVYDSAARSVTITAKGSTYITKIVVVKDDTISAATPVSSLEISSSSKNFTVGVGVTLTATSNKDATNQSVIWSSSDETAATIDPYTGRVTFKKAGKVTFTATALDGSEVSQSLEVTAKSANWTVCEWYTTDGTLDSEEGCVEIGNFDLTTSEKKDMKNADGEYDNYTFETLAGSVTTKTGLKLNSKGKVQLALTKPVTLTVIIGKVGKTVADPSVYLDENTKATYLTKNVDGVLTTYTYRLEAAGTWTIERGDTSSENDPIMYMKAEVDAQPIKSLSYNFSKLEDIPAAGLPVDSTNEIKFEGCLSHDGNQHIIMKENNAVTIKLAKGATLTIGMNYSSSEITVNGTAVALVDNKLVYTATADGDVVIRATQAGKAYIQTIDVATYIDTLSYNFSKLEDIPATGEAVASTEEIKFEGCLSHDGKQHIIMKENNAVTINLAAGSTLTIGMNYSSSEITVNGTAVALVDNKLVYTATANETVVIKATQAGKAYIQTIDIAKAV